MSEQCFTEAPPYEVRAHSVRLQNEPSAITAGPSCDVVIGTQSQVPMCARLSGTTDCWLGASSGALPQSPALVAWCIAPAVACSHSNPQRRLRVYACVCMCVSIWRYAVTHSLALAC